MTANAADLSDWAIKDYVESNSTGLLSYKLASNDMRSNITREEFCELVINLYQKLTNESLRIPDESPFTDCDNTAVSQAYYNGIVSGVSETEFEPLRFVTRQEMSKMLVNALNAAEVSMAVAVDTSTKDLESFADYEKVSEWAIPSVSTMVNHGLLSGNIDNEIMPLENTTREQAIACVSRAYRNFAEITQDRYMLPIVEVPKSGDVLSKDIEVKWSTVDSAVGYHVLVKDEKGMLAYESELTGDILKHKLPDSALSNGKYSVVIGAIMETGDIVFSVPVDFEKAVEEVKPSNPAANEQDVVLDYSKEVMSDKAKELIAEAEKYLGIPYVYGGTTPAGFDCSGFMQYVYKNCGITLTRVSRDQYAKNGVAVAKSDLQPGDLVFFGTNGNVSHVGMYTGKGMMIHSPSTGKSIMYTSIETDYYVSHYIGAKRVI